MAGVLVETEHDVFTRGKGGKDPFCLFVSFSACLLMCVYACYCGHGNVLQYWMDFFRCEGMSFQDFDVYSLGSAELEDYDYYKQRWSSRSMSYARGLHQVVDVPNRTPCRGNIENGRCE